ncbi:MAG: hypothetical protein HQM14_00545 [SAR324 cluster bacterium]|nr:hypothetical protein [SAR324 cluster bacterium]
MTTALSKEETFRREALAWFKSTNPTPRRQVSEEQIEMVYKRTKEYAESDPLLAKFYISNHMHL